MSLTEDEVTYFFRLTFRILLADFSLLPPVVPIEKPPGDDWLCWPNWNMPGEADVAEANWVAGVLNRVGVDGELLGRPKGEAAEKANGFLSPAIWPPFIWSVPVLKPTVGLGVPKSGVVGDAFGIVGVAEVNENTGLEVELKGEVAGEPKGGAFVLVKLLQKIGEDAEAGVAEVVPEPTANENTGLEPGADEPNAKLGELPGFTFSEDNRFELLVEVCADSELLNWLPDSKVDWEETALDLPWPANGLVLPNCGEKLKGALLLAALDLSWPANELSLLDWEENWKGTLPLVVMELDWEVAPANIIEDGDELPPAKLLTVLNGAVIAGSWIPLDCTEEVDVRNPGWNENFGNEGVEEPAFVEQTDLVDPLEGNTAAEADFVVSARPLLKVVGFEEMTLNTGLLVKETICPELWEIGGLSVFDFVSHWLKTEASSETGLKTLEKKTCQINVLEISEYPHKLETEA